MRKIMAAAAVVLAGATLTVSATTGTASTGSFFTFEAAPGAHPVGNRYGGYDLDPVRDEVTGYEKTIRIFAGPREDAWSVELKAPEGQRLRPGVFENVRYHQGHGPTPGMLVIHNGIGCADVFATFTIDRYEHGPGAVVFALDGSLEHRCGSPNAPALKARFSYRQPAGISSPAPSGGN